MFLKELTTELVVTYTPVAIRTNGGVSCDPHLYMLKEPMNELVVTPPLTPVIYYCICTSSVG
jgi:hypothetical protein